VATCRCRGQAEVRPVWTAFVRFDSQIGRREIPLARNPISGSNLKVLAEMFRPFLVLLALAIVSPMLSINSVSAEEIVRYRLPDWKRKHLHDVGKADKIVDTLKKLGCEVEKLDHNGHVDVKYRCPEWRQIKPSTHDEAVRWEKWFKEFYFLVEHKHGG